MPMTDPVLYAMIMVCHWTSTRTPVLDPHLDTIHTWIRHGNRNLTQPSENFGWCIAIPFPLRIFNSPYRNHMRQQSVGKLHFGPSHGALLFLDGMKLINIIILCIYIYKYIYIYIYMYNGWWFPFLGNLTFIPYLRIQHDTTTNDGEVQCVKLRESGGRFSASCDACMPLFGGGIFLPGALAKLGIPAASASKVLFGTANANFLWDRYNLNSNNWISTQVA